jgi:hypothetical protein
MFRRRAHRQRSPGQPTGQLYLRLRAIGIFPDDAPHTIRAFGQATGRLTIEELVDRYPLRCRPIRGLLVDYLRERQPSLDFASIDAISRSLAGLFWARIEAIAPGIDTLQLPQDIVRTWKDKTRPHHQADLWAAALVDFGGFCRRNFVLISLT